ncbi:helix-turn-helix transcriptional regulator [Flavobacterium rakeshii]|uniref:helix-turn-helix domain-containing protein n=1 Tax=Flavobacterium rakeshii TaxID=1038845 RepID=UPI002E7C316E|nr:helix-turn-helix transcriptional regulator [Flavobacterium rakeshii]MEE1896983.1 helix-turn-helix transcriptional regulator [Flavobacterium rakeshii]
MAKNSHKVTLQISLGKKLKELRNEKKLSLRQLAQRCDLDYSDISKYEKGEVNIQLSTVYELARGLNVQPKDLFNFEFKFPEE